MTEDDDIYEVEHVVAHKNQKDGIYYLIKWKGWSDSDSTWERADNLFCAKKVKEYWNKLQQTQLSERKSQINRKPALARVEQEMKEIQPGKQFYVIDTSDDTTSSDKDSYSQYSDTGSVESSSGEIISFSRSDEKDQITNTETELSTGMTSEHDEPIWISESTDVKDISDSPMPVEDNLDWTRNRITIESVLPEKPLRFVVFSDGSRKILSNEEVKRRYPQQLIDFYLNHIQLCA